MLEFTCPKCGKHRLEEIMVDVTVVSEIEDVSEDGDVYYGQQNNEDGDIDCYRCANCGYVLLEVEDDGTNLEEVWVSECTQLAAWLKKRDMIT